MCVSLSLDGDKHHIKITLHAYYTVEDVMICCYQKEQNALEHLLMATRAV